MTGNTVQVDYANPLSEHHKIEAGLKHIYRNSTSDTDNKQSDEYGTFPIEKIKFTGMDYRQHVLGIYAGYGFTYTKWSGRLGARMERTWNDAQVEETAKGTYSFSNRQFNVVPYLSLTFIPKVSHNISLSYTQRLQRPGIYMLSPAEDDTDPTRLSYGNPGLEAAVYHTINLQYGHYAAKWSMTFALNTFLSNNNMSSYSFSDGDGITNTTYSNDVRSRSYGFNGSFSYRPSEKVNLSLSYNGRYSQNDFDAMDIHTDQFTFSQNLNLDFALWKEARLMLGENYSTGYAWLGGKSESYYYYYMGIKQQFLKKKLDLSIMCNNPFEKYRRNRSTSDTPTFGGWSEYRYACRSLYFRVSYRFGKQNVGVKRTAKSIRNDDMSSGAQGGGGGSTGGAQGGGNAVRDIAAFARGTVGICPQAIQHGKLFVRNEIVPESGGADDQIEMNIPYLVPNEGQILPYIWRTAAVVGVQEGLCAGLYVKFGIPEQIGKQVGTQLAELAG